MTDPSYKTAMNVSRNGHPTVSGAWTKRSGTRYLGTSKAGDKARLVPFDFTITQPYQLEFTDQNVRFIAGLDYLTTLVEDGPIYVDQVTNTNPAKLILASAMPSWSNGDTILFRMPTVPVSCPPLLGRTFLLSDKDTDDNSFLLKDPITGAYIDATGYGYVPGGEDTTPDTVEKIFELATPYTANDLEDLRWVQDDTTLLLLHGSYQPRVISSGAPFSIAAQAFTDGPYLDLNTTTTTLTPSGTSGSINLTASALTGINGGFGFLSTDVGRLVRFQSGPPTWSNAITYAKNFTVTGSDGNVYVSVAGSNLNHDPTTDSGLYWIIGTTTVTWTWLLITAITSTTVVVATVMGADLSATNASSAWQLGLYSDTTGWPKGGAYHEDRLWLYGVVGNRVDSSMSGQHFVFTPTSTDGTVADDNGISAIAASREVNAFHWAISMEDGLMLGTQGGEWRIRASTFDDPISPSSIQMRQVSAYGCANIDPIRASQLVFVQRQQRRLLAQQQVTDTHYIADHLSEFADDLTAPGVAEIRWQQEPALTIWARCEDGTVFGCVFQKGYNVYMRTGSADASFRGFFTFDLGNGRVVESISSGPSFDGLSDAIYLVTNQPDEDAPDYNVRWIETVLPVFDDSQADWSPYFVDGGANPKYCQLYAVANGDSFDGIRIFGLWPLNGQTISPVIGGLDLGDRSVSSGYCDVPFGSDPEGAFTLAFFTGLSDGTDYGIFQSDVGYVVQGQPVAPPVGANNLLAYVGADANVIGSSGSYAHIDNLNSRVWEMINPTIGISEGGGIRQFNSDTGAEILSNDNASIFGPDTSLGAWNSGTTYAQYDVVTGSDTVLYRSLAGGNINHNPVGDGGVHWEARAAASTLISTVSYKHRDGHIYCNAGPQHSGFTNSCPMAKIDATALTVSAIYGSSGSQLSGSVLGRLQGAFFSMAGPRVLQDDNSYKNYLVFCGITSGGVSPGYQVTLISTDSTMLFLDAQWLDEYSASVCTAVSKHDYTSWLALGWPNNWYSNWAGGTTYATGDKVFGSDGNVYESLANSNTGNDPTTDAGVHWELEPKPIGVYQCFITSGLESDGFVLRKIGMKLGPKDIDSTWTSISQLIGPAYDKTDHNMICLVGTTDSVTTQNYVVKIDVTSGAVLWKCALDDAVTSFGSYQSMSVADISTSKLVLMRAGASNHKAYIIDTTNGSLTTQAINTGFSGVAPQYYDPASGSITFKGSFTPPGTGPTMTYLGTWLPANSDTLSSQYGRLYLGLDHTADNTVTDYKVPVSAGAAFTAQGQLLRPDYGEDAGPRNGPAFGKLRRIHSWAGSFYRSRKVTVGTDFTVQQPVKLLSPGGNPIPAPGLSTQIKWDTINSGDSFAEQIAWQSVRPYPCVLLAVGGYLELSDK